MEDMWDEVSVCCGFGIFTGSIRTGKQEVTEHTFCMECGMECETISQEEYEKQN